MMTEQAERIQRRFLPLVDQTIALLKARAVEQDGVLPDFVNDAEVIVLVYAAYTFLISAETQLAPQVGGLNAALAGELTRTINHYADRGRVGKRPFHEDERADFARTIYERVYAGMAAYAVALQKDIRQISHRQTLIFSETTQHFLGRYIVEPPMLARIAPSRSRYAEIVDQVLDGVTLCLQT